MSICVFLLALLFYIYILSISYFFTILYMTTERKDIKECDIIYKYRVSYSNSEDETFIYCEEWIIYRLSKAYAWIIPKPYAISVCSSNDKRFDWYKWVHPHDNQDIKNHWKRISISNVFWKWSTKEKAFKYFEKSLANRIRWMNYWKEECEKALEICAMNECLNNSPTPYEQYTTRGNT